MPTKSNSRLRAGEPFRFTLTSAAQNVRVGDWQISSRDLKLPGVDAGWSVRQRTLHGGKQAGVELIEVDTGRLRIVIIPTRGMGILTVQSRDVRLGWDSPVKEVVHPQFINLALRGGTGWLEGFNEWLVRCGLENMGAPGPDEFTNAAGGKSTMDLPLHGKIANIPASEVEVIIERTVPYRIRVRGRVDERMLFGPQLELWAEVATEIGRTRFTIEDTVTNRAGTAQEFQLLYHVNYGPPLLEACARFAAPVASVTPVTAQAAKEIQDYAGYVGPTAGLAERVYCFEPLANAAGKSVLVLHNAAADRAASLEFSVAELPCVTLWKNPAALADGYVTGLEPGTSYPLGRARERAAGRVPRLEPGESRVFRSVHAIHVGKAPVAAVLADIQRVQGGTAPKLTNKPLV